MGEKLNPAGGGGGGRGIGGMEADASGFDVGMRVKGDICKTLRVSGAVSIFCQTLMMEIAIVGDRQVGLQWRKEWR